jgi:hypothetical protein
MSGEKSLTAQVMAPMERILKDASLLRDAHYNVIRRLRVIRENMTGPIPENPGKEIKTEGSGAFGMLQDRMSEMDDLLNGSLEEIIRIEKAMGVCPEVAPPPGAYVEVDRHGRIGR